MTRPVCSARPWARLTNVSPASAPSVAMPTVNCCAAPEASSGPMTRTAVASGVNSVVHPTVFPVTSPARPLDGCAGSSLSCAGSAVV